MLTGLSLNYKKFSFSCDSLSNHSAHPQMLYPGIQHLEVIDAQDHTSNELPPHVLLASKKKSYYLKNELLSCIFEYF
jgi:hypothetical protein